MCQENYWIEKYPNEVSNPVKWDHKLVKGGMDGQNSKS